MAEPLLSIEINSTNGKLGRIGFHVVMANGTEGISIPYIYEVTLFRPSNLPDINPKTVVDTVAILGINRKSGNNFDPFLRMGIIEHFEKAGFGTKDSKFRVFTARIVPPFKLLDREVVFRVFEDMDVVTILETVLRSVPNLQINTRLLRQGGIKFPKMEYCVQFGESTFGFLSRLMHRFGIHYYFDTLGGPDAPQNELMIFGESRTLEEPCQQATVDIVPDNDLKQRTDAVAGFVQRFDPVFWSSKSGNFNILEPTKPFVSTRPIDPGFDLTSDTAGPAHGFKSEEFPTPSFSQADATDYVKRFQEQEEAKVATIAGRGNNRTFIAGRNIFIARIRFTIRRTRRSHRSTARPIC